MQILYDLDKALLINHMLQPIQLDYYYEAIHMKDLLKYNRNWMKEVENADIGLLRPYFHVDSKTGKVL
jgi:hypothetical protein